MSLRLFDRMEKVEKAVVLALVVLMTITVLVSAVELTIILFGELAKPPFGLLDIDNLLQIFGFFFMVLIGLELLESIKTYLRDDQFHVEIVLLVALIALARKVIIVDTKEMTPGMLYGIAGLILSLSTGYYLVKKAWQLNPRPRTPAPPRTPPQAP